MRKENRLYNTVSIILSIQVITWIRQDSDTVLIKTLQLRNRFSERTPIYQYLRIMNSKLLKKLEEIKKEYETSEVCMGEMLDSISADGFSLSRMLTGCICVQWSGRTEISSISTSEKTKMY